MVNKRQYLILFNLYGYKSCKKITINIWNIYSLDCVCVWCCLIFNSCLDRHSGKFLVLVISPGRHVFEIWWCWKLSNIPTAVASLWWQLSVSSTVDFRPWIRVGSRAESAPSGIPTTMRNVQMLRILWQVKHSRSYKYRLSAIIFSLTTWYIFRTYPVYGSKLMQKHWYIWNLLFL